MYGQKVTRQSNIFLPNHFFAMIPNRFEHHAFRGVVRKKQSFVGSLFDLRHG